ncbi:MAG: PAAR domain-containing protein [Candidatus Thiosymbion ectosymbiont of Robbea hypermnestra]|nr:PAAR domain-containing protein [Candidatus Thiosymbion ectosymbiont of Robbea hypermnestra]
MSQPAARIGDAHTCPHVDPGPKPHVGGPILEGCPTVLIGGQPAARVGDKATCIGPPDTIATGEPTVLIGGKPAARLGDTTAHGGLIVTGNATVLIGSGSSLLSRRGSLAFQRDPNGNILARKIGGLSPVEHGGAPGDTFVVQEYELVLQDGSTIKATKSLGRYDPTTRRIVPDARMDTDCHGVTFADGKYWINDGEVDDLLAGGGFSKTNTPQPGDVLIYRNQGGDVVHSVTVSKTDAGGNVTEVTGLGGLETIEHSAPPDQAWHDPNATQEVWTK